MRETSRVIIRLVTVLLVLTAPFYVYNLSQGMDAEESLRALPSSYERSFQWTAEVVNERIGNIESTLTEDTEISPAGTPANAPTASEPSGLVEQAGGDAEISGIEDGREHIGLMEEIVLERTNHHRQVEGVGDLSLDPELSDIARAHSQDMSENGYFAHENLEGQSPSERAAEAGYTCRKFFGLYYTEGVAENLFRGHLYSSYTRRGQETTYNYMSAREIAELAVDSLMESPGHRENILQENFDLLGVGIAVSDDQEVYVTQKFC